MLFHSKAKIFVKCQLIDYIFGYLKLYLTFYLYSIQSYFSLYLYMHSLIKCCVFSDKLHIFSYLELAYVQNMGEGQQQDQGREEKKKKKEKNGQKDFLGWFMQPQLIKSNV